MADSKEDATKISLNESSISELKNRITELEKVIDLLLRAMGFDPDNLPNPNDPNMPHFILKRIDGLKPRRQVKKKRK